MSVGRGWSGAGRLVRVPRKILVTGGPVGSIDFIEVPAKDEVELQKLLLQNPQLIPADDLGLDGDLLVVGRETPLASGRIDLLCLSRTGELVIVEFKTGPKNPDFRHALAQVIDYGSDIWKSGDWTSFDRGVVQPFLKSDRVAAKFNTCADLHAASDLAWSLTAEEWTRLTDRLDQVIKRGDFRFVVAAQRFTETMKVSVSYLNATVQAGQYYLVEVIRLDGPSQTAFAAQVVHKPEVRRGSVANSTAKATEDEFLDAIDDYDYREAMSDLFSALQPLGLTLAWGSKGASIRLKSPDRPEPISVGWVFLPGDLWTFARHVTFGVDPGTLQNHPTIAPFIMQFCKDLKEIPGGKPAGKNPEARVFEPSAFVGTHDDLIGLLGDLTAAVSG